MITTEHIIQVIILNNTTLSLSINLDLITIIMQKLLIIKENIWCEDIVKRLTSCLTFIA